MRRITAYIFIWGLLASMTANATDDPHGAASSINCEECHITHGSLGEILVNAADELVSTLCLSCHTPGGWVGMTKELSSSQKADPGVTGTSHDWDISPDNATYGSDVPLQQPLIDHLSASGSITCATCHNPHENSTPPFLRMDNSADALCLDCHRSRNLTSTRTYTGNTLSHPIGIVLPSTDDFHNPPLDVDGNPQPSDGNTTNDYELAGGTDLKCTTCHGVHYTDSNSGTVDGP